MRWLTWRDLWLPPSPQVVTLLHATRLSWRQFPLLPSPQYHLSPSALGHPLSGQAQLQWLARQALIPCHPWLAHQARLHRPWLACWVLLHNHPWLAHVGRPQGSQPLFPHHVLSRRHLSPHWIRARDLQTLLWDIPYAAVPVWRPPVILRIMYRDGLIINALIQDS